MNVCPKSINDPLSTLYTYVQLYSFLMDAFIFTVLDCMIQLKNSCMS